MTTIIAGSRDATREDTLKAIEAAQRAYPRLEITEVVCGQARGPDTFGEEWALENDIPVRYFPADWKKYGKQAGPIRNRAMAEYACGGFLIAAWNGKSPGTRNMIEQARNFELSIFVYRTDK